MNVMVTTEATVPTQSLAERIDANRDSIREVVEKFGYADPRIASIDERVVGCDYDYPDPGSENWRGEVHFIVRFVKRTGMFAFFGIDVELSDLLQAHTVTHIDEGLAKQESAEAKEMLANAWAV